jgi:poly [ADP-ribose] polymerase
MTKKYAMLLMNNAAGNNNKFYELKLEDDDSVIIRYGRVGSTGVTENKGNGESTFEKVKNSKIKKGYKEVDIVISDNGTTTSTSGSLVEIAKRDIANGDESLHNLLERLSQINRFQLLAASGGQIDIVDGEVKTALGVLIPLSSIDSAKNKLNDLSNLVKTNDIGNEYITLLQDYLTLVPQKIPSKRGWDKNFFTEFTTFENQSDLLEQLENSVKNSKPTINDSSDEPIGKLFGYSLETVNDDNIFDKINSFYNKGINKSHMASNRKLYKIYKMINDDKLSEFKQVSDKIGNVQMLWHGTRAHNILSILKGGLIIPPLNGNYSISGRMFSSGVYFSDQSTKSLNYSAGYWGTGGYESGNIFMLNASVAMGKSYIPSGPLNTFPSNYDSIFAIGGKSGVKNNEMIVPSLNQFSLDYLCEFE